MAMHPRLKFVVNLQKRLFFLTPSLIGSINGRIFILTNQQVVLMELVSNTGPKANKVTSLGHRIQVYTLCVRG